MKKALFIIVMILSVHTAFCSQEVKYRDNSYSGNGLIIGSVIMMALPSIPLTLFTAGGIVAATGFLGFLTDGFLMGISIPFILSLQTVIAGSLMLNYAVRKYVRGDYYWEAGKMMRNAGIVIMVTSLIPTACCAALSAFLFPIAVDVITGILALAHIACGAVFLGMGLHRIRADKIPLPEVSVVHDDKKGYNEGYAVNVGVRIKI